MLADYHQIEFDTWLYLTWLEVRPKATAASNRPSAAQPDHSSNRPLEDEDRAAAHIWRAIGPHIAL